MKGIGFNEFQKENLIVIMCLENRPENHLGYYDEVTLWPLPASDGFFFSVGSEFFLISQDRATPLFTIIH